VVAFSKTCGVGQRNVRRVTHHRGAALIVLVLVFGAVVAAVVPLVMAIVSIVVALGLCALVALTRSVFVINMLTGMGLALGIDYALFVVSAGARSLRRNPSVET
jgi:RND superfamily putative drug exporter